MPLRVAEQHITAGTTDDGEITNMHIRLRDVRGTTLWQFHLRLNILASENVSVHDQWTLCVVVLNLNVINLSQVCLVFDWPQLFPPPQQTLHSWTGLQSSRSNLRSPGDRYPPLRFRWREFIQGVWLLTREEAESGSVTFHSCQMSNLIFS